MEEVDWLQSLINGYRSTALVGVAARLRLADHIAGGRQSVTALATVTGTRVDRLRHVVRALSALGLLIEVNGGRLVLTRFGELLCADHPQSLRSSAAYACAVSGPAFDGLLESLSSDQTAFRHRFGTDFYTHLAGQPDIATDFNQMLAVPGLAEAVAGAVDLSGVDTVVDVGGGDGQLLAELLRTDDRVHGVLLDLPEILHGASPPADPQLAARYMAQPGDFFEVVPSVGQIYLLARVLANWDEHDAARILRTCRAAMHETDRLIVVEQLLPPHAEVGAFVHLGNMDLLVNFGGQLRTATEHETLLSSAGLRLLGVERLDVAASGDWAALVTTRG